MPRCCFLVLASLLTVAPFPVLASAMGGTDVREVHPQPCTAAVDCPTGLDALLTDPTCVLTWNHRFSEAPNDVENYGYRIDSVTDLQRLANHLGEVDHIHPQIQLRPETGPSGDFLPDDRDLGVVFSHGNQEILNRWYEQLPVNESGERTWGVHTYVKPPVARPPTLMIYVGHPSVNLESLNVPPSVEVSAELSPAWKDPSLGSSIVRDIRAFIEAHRARQRVELDPFIPPFLRTTLRAEMTEKTNVP